MSWSELSTDSEDSIISFLRPSEALALRGTCKRLSLKTLFPVRAADSSLFALAQRCSLVLPFVKKLRLQYRNNLDGIEDIFPGLVDLRLDGPVSKVLDKKVFKNR